MNKYSNMGAAAGYGPMAQMVDLNAGMDMDRMDDLDGMDYDQEIDDYDEDIDGSDSNQSPGQQFYQ